MLRISQVRASIPRLVAPSLSSAHFSTLPSAFKFSRLTPKPKINTVKPVAGKPTERPSKPSKPSNRTPKVEKVESTKSQPVPFQARGRVALVGRPNVGKSTLFNRLVGRKVAIVDPTPGTTRDRKSGKGSIAGLEFHVVDTPGLDDADQEDSISKQLQSSMTAQTLAAVRESDVVVFMVDVRAGLTPLDSHFATWLRRNIGTKPIIVVANKGEGKMTETDAMEFASLGISNDAPLLMSAEHNEGMDDLFQALNQSLPAQSAEPDLKPAIKPVAVNKAVTSAKLDEMPDDKADAELLTMMKEAAKEPVDRSVLADAPPITLAIIGRPNVGKSTLINALVGDDSRLVVSPRAHTTRDSVVVDFACNGRDMKLVDTAGLIGLTGTTRRRLSRLDGLVMDDAVKTLQLANVCALVVDIEPNVPESTIVELLTKLRESATAAAKLNRPDYISRLAALVFPSIDVSIAARAVDEGRALVLLVNKLDRLHQRLHRDVIDGLDAIVKHVLPSARGLPILPISALERSNLDQILPAAIKQFDRWNTLIPTYKLNQWLREVTRQNPPPRLAGRSTRIRFIKQTHARPPHFGLFFSSTPDALPDSYVRYLTNRMRADFDLHGVPIRVTVRKSKNPYASTEVQRAQSMPKRIL